MVSLPYIRELTLQKNNNNQVKTHLFLTKQANAEK